MSFDFSSISSDPLIYFLTHSTVFVAGMAATFFCLGLVFGWLTWARYKIQRRELLGETESLKEEIATLKRKLAEQIVRASVSTENQTASTGEKPVRPAHAEPDPVLDSFLSTAASILPQAASTPRQPPPSAAADGISAQRAAPPPEDPAVAPPSIVAPEPPAKPAARHKPRAKKGVLQSLVRGEMGDQLVDHAGADAALPGMPQPLPSTKQAGAQSSAFEAETPQPAPAAGDSASTVESRLMSDPHLGLVYASRPGLSDDLSHLKGVASTIERKLNDYGVYTFKQIALWSEENIREFSNLLAFKDRIHREQWVEQARELHFQKYGERL